MKYFLFKLIWNWKHRNWEETRQKRKAFERDWANRKWW